MLGVVLVLLLFCSQQVYYWWKLVPAVFVALYHSNVTGKWYTT